MQGTRRRFGLLGGAMAAIACAIPVSAGAANERAAVESCAAGLAPAGAAGIERSAFTAPAQGLFTARLGGGLAPDWDLAVYRRGDAEAVASSSSFTSNEQATLWVERGDRLEIQSCRLAGDAPAPELALDLNRLPDPAPSTQRISLESVAISGPHHLATLERLGFDVTHDVTARHATVVLYSDAQRALLASAGFSSRALIADLPAFDAAERTVERRAAARDPGRSALPSGRDSYRVYDDYTSEMKGLVQANPGLARSLVLGSTLEGRPIEGIELATGVDRVDDGRPVYLNFGMHHAREWPSGEYPIEFAIDLVEGYNAGDPRIRALLDSVRVVIVPVVNVDGFIASRSFGTSPADEDSLATAGLALSDAAAYKRKNCRPTVPGQAALPCAMRVFSGVDLNRNYGAYWGGNGSSSDPTSSGYRGTGPYSEPESEAVHRYTSTIHPTVFITNHTFTSDGKWLRQPGFDDVISVTPDEAAMKSLGDAMAGATGWTSELGYETLGDITGATEDWNYFAQGTYGYTPEARAANFHPNYAGTVVEEYLGDAQHPGLGVREAFLIAGERAASPADHSVIAGAAPAGGELGLRKEFATPTSLPDLVVNDVLDTKLAVPANGAYEWHTNPSSRPLVPGETWTMTCRSPAGAQGSAQVAVARGERVTVDWSARCAPGGDVGARCAGRQATMVGSGENDVLRGTNRRDVIAAKGGKDKVRARGRNDVVCGGGGKDRIKGGGGNDKLRGGGGRDTIRGGAGKDRIKGGGGRDRCSGGPGKDKVRGCA